MIDDPVLITVFLIYTAACIAYGWAVGQSYEQGRAIEREEEAFSGFRKSFFERMLSGGRNG